MTLMRARFQVADAALAREAADLLAYVEPVPAHASSYFEAPDRGSWIVDAYFNEPGPDIGDLLLALSTLLPDLPEIDIVAVPEENWVALTQAGLPPVAAGAFVIHGGHDRARVGRRHTAIEIDAGEAFGTAHHATTEGCLWALDALLRRRSFGRVLDLGCGAGVLAIAARRRLPLAEVTGSDIDPVAIDVARVNGRVNRCAGSIAWICAADLAHGRLRQRGPFDLVLANILAGPLVRLAPTLKRSVSMGGFVVLSGILDVQAREVRATYLAAGFRLARQQIERGWATLVLRRQ